MYNILRKYDYQNHDFKNMASTYKQYIGNEKLEYIQYPEKYKLHIKQKISMFVFNAVSLKQIRTST